MIDYNNYLDLWNILVYEIVGSLPLFVFLGTILILFLCNKFSFSFNITLLVVVLFYCVVAANTLNPVIWVIVNLLAGVILFEVIGERLNR